MKQQGAIIVDPANIESAGKFGDSELTVLLYEFKTSLEQYLRERSSTGPQTIKDLMAFNENHRAIEMPYFEQEIFELADKKGPLTDKVYLDALERNHRLAATEGIDATLKKDKLDAIVAPTYGPVMPIDLILGDHLVPPWTSQQWTPSAPAVAGYPHISVPAGYIFGVPVGISFISEMLIVNPRSSRSRMRLSKPLCFESRRNFSHVTRSTNTLHKFTIITPITLSTVCASGTSASRGLPNAFLLIKSA